MSLSSKCKESERETVIFYNLIQFWFTPDKNNLDFLPQKFDNSLKRSSVNSELHSIFQTLKNDLEKVCFKETKFFIVIFEP